MKPCIIITSNNKSVYDSVLMQKDCGQCDVVVNQKDEAVNVFMSRTLALCPKKLDPADIIILLHNQDRLGKPETMRRILETFHSNPHITALYTDCQEMVDGFCIDRYMPAYYRSIMNTFNLNTPVAFKASTIENIEPKYDNLYHDIFVAATRHSMGHHIPEPLFLCQL